MDQSVCGRHSTCVNSDGSYTCPCDVGYRRTGQDCEGMCQPLVPRVRLNTQCITTASLVQLCIITAELGRAPAVVKVTLQVNGNSQFLEVRPSKTIGAIKIKSGTNDYVGEGNPHAKFGNIPITGGFSPYR